MGTLQSRTIGFLRSSLPRLWALGRGFASVGAEAAGALSQEILIKAILMSFNDANVTGNYAVFHARLSKPFRDKYSAEQLEEVFKPFTRRKSISP